MIQTSRGLTLQKGRMVGHNRQPEDRHGEQDQVQTVAPAK